MAQVPSPLGSLNLLIQKLNKTLAGDRQVTLTEESLSDLQLILREAKISTNDVRGLTAEEKKRLSTVAVLEMCLPCFAAVCGPSTISTTEVFGAIGHLAEIILAAVEFLDADVLVQTVNRLLSYLEPSKALDCSGEQDLVAIGSHQKQLSIYLLFQLLCQQPFIDAIIVANIAQLVFEGLLTAIKSADVTSCYHIASLLLPCLVAREHSRRIKQIWEYVYRVWTSSLTTEMRALDVVLTLLCCLSDWFLPTRPPLPGTVQASKGLGVCSEKAFWEVIQHGLTDRDPLSRKRCRYLMERALSWVKELKYEGQFCSEGEVFWWASNQDERDIKEVTEVWEGLLLLLETLEEKQVVLKSLVEIEIIVQCK